jgi:omega-amidase
MKISLIQSTLRWADKVTNLATTEALIAKLAGKTDLVVLAEMFTTGFCTDQLELAETMEGETIRSLRAWSCNYQLAITGSIIVAENGKTYNRAFFVFPDGKINYVDKKHLFSMGGENKYFSAGNEKLIVNYLNFNINILICYDIRFPVWSRNINNEYDLLIYVANFPERRINHWDILLQARAIENQCYVCGVNRIGSDGLGIKYNGHSVLLDYNAQTLVSFTENESGIGHYELNKQALEDYRAKFAVWNDADPFQLID